MRAAKTFKVNWTNVLLPKKKNGLVNMKRTLLVTFTKVTLCSLLLLIAVEITRGSEPGYTYIAYPTEEPPTIDGAWTSPDEWTGGNATWVNENVTFISTFYTETPIFRWTSFIIEILNDNTTDTGDYWQIILDAELDGGTAPKTDDYRIDVVGHTSPTVYQGTGTGWTEVTPDPGEVQFAESISASPTSSTPHWIAEFTIYYYGGAIIIMTLDQGLRVAVYDESNGAAGVQAWPPTARDVPNGWGICLGSEVPIPEGLGFGAFMVLSSVAVIVATLGFRKRSRTRNSN